MNTRIHYMYRDASNYKFRGSFLVRGRFDVESVRDFLFDGEFFVPHEVGIEHLLDMPMNEDDHYLHTIEGAEPSSDTDTRCDASSLVKRFELAHEKGWLSSLR